jgi:hypothetical protein
VRSALGLALAVAACSNAASPEVDAYVGPRVDAPPPADAAVDTPPGVAIRIVVLDEIAASESPDWIEVVNATTGPIELSDFVYVDVAGDFMKARAFPVMTLGPGGRYVQTIDDASSGFKLASDEELWIYRASDHALSDGVDWAEGDSPAGMSFARSPDVFGPFVTGAPSRGAPNP